MSRVAVTGATGFIGRHLVDCLTNSGFEVRALCRGRADSVAASGAAVVLGSLEGDEDLRRLVDGAAAVVHCAGLLKGPAGSDFDRANREGTERLARICRQRSAPPRLIFLSSLAARHPELSDYAASKRAAEAALAGGAGDMHWTILRPPAVYGPRDKGTLPLFRLMKRGILPVPNRRSSRFSLIYVADLCEAVKTLLASDLESGVTFEIRDACEDGYRWLDIAEAGRCALRRRVICLPVPRVLMTMAAAANFGICRLNGATPTITAGKVQEFYHKNWVCIENDLTRCTNWRPNTAIYGGFDRTISWYLENNLL